MNKNAIHTTLDVYQAGFLTLEGFPPKLLKKNQKVVFSFELLEHLIKALSEYMGDELVRANDFANTIKLVKSRIFAVKRDYNGRMGKKTGNDNRKQSRHTI